MTFSGKYAVITSLLVLVHSCLAHRQKLLLVKHSYSNSSLNILNETPLHLSAERNNIVGYRKLLEDITLTITYLLTYLAHLQLLIILMLT